MLLRRGLHRGLFTSPPLFVCRQLHQRTPPRLCSKPVVQNPPIPKSETERPAEKKPELPKSGIDPRVWPIATSSLLMGSAIGVIIPVMPSLALQLGLSQAQYGLVISIMGGTRLLVNLPLAAIGDGLGRKPLLVLGPVFSAIAMVMTGLATTLWELVVWRFVTGVSGAAQMTGGQLYLSDISTRLNRARTMAPNAAAFSAGMMIGPAIGGYVADSFGLRAPFLVVGVAVAAAAANNWLRLAETRVIVPHSGPQKTMYERCKTHIQVACSQWLVLLKEKNVRSCVVLHGTFWMAASGSQFTLLPLLVTQNFAMSLSEIGGLFALMAGMNVLFSQPAAFLSDRYGRKLTMIPGAVMSAGSLLALSAVQTPTQLVGLLVVWGVGNSFFGTGAVSYVADVTSSENRAQALALLRSAGDFGLMVGAGFAGLLADLVGIPFSLAMNSTLLLCSAVYFALRAVDPRTLPPQN
eukprot:c17187_g1_i1.p1 GENE.c17187_g1_i1~~c17187_g1_i1.p1  ORF type:complete len:465 (-),score=80.21 c17187_g1_i1:112-1506(-)